MLDKNGVEIKTGQIVEINGAYFKNNNGLYFVTRSPGDPGWCGSDHCLTKISKTGKISKAKYNLCFWPIVSGVSDRFKTAEQDPRLQNGAEECTYTCWDCEKRYTCERCALT